MLTRHRRIITSTTNPSALLSFSSSLSSLLTTSTRTAYFVHHKKTPNDDCMMFVVPNFRFRIGNQAELERTMKEALEKKYGLNQTAAEEEEEEDWDGPGPNLVGNKTSQETKEEKLEKVRKIAVEQFQIQRKQYFAKRDEEMMMTNENDNKSSSKKATSVESNEANAACETTDGKDFFEKVNLPKSRTGGSSVHRAASMPTKKMKNAADEEKVSSSSSSSQEVVDFPSSTSSSATGFLNDDDEATYVNATYSFTKETMHMSPLAKRVFECEAGANITEVVIGRDFLTVRRKSEEDLILEKEQKEAEEEEEAARLKEEEEQQEGDESSSSSEKKERKMNTVSYNDGQGEIIATSLNTLSGMVNTKSKNKSGTDDDQQKQKQEHEQQVSETREKLSQMYNESAEKTSQSASSSCSTSSSGGGGWKQKSLDETNEENSNEQNNSNENSSSSSITPAQWFDLQFPITAAVTDHLHFAEVAVDLSAPHPYADTEPNPDDSEIISSIKELISEHLRPLLQSDGGDIRFHGFFPEEDSIIKVEMLGSCKTCKKSDTTLRDLIERTIRHFVPEVSGVVEINGRMAPASVEKS